MPRKQYLTLVLLTISTHLFAQGDVPYNVKIQFMDEYISASSASWNKVNTEYLVSFNHQSHFKKASYASNGTRMFLETKLMSLAEAPQAVGQAIKRRYRSYMIDDIWKTETSDDVIYKLLIRKEDKIYSVEFFQTGKQKSKTRICQQRT
ncbi:hypothetical protein KK083_26045 [Fulvivirgaceae bacterium PWU4]|uniref:Beta-lactamase-inhibitor-like PepSY-like domain-containing protein n=2 Tax=Chryseosolibacter histidini TaxID=2782349 RepID=A0AAP2DQ19_9BACT|nr:hypothetical protein [Chryseosolibacter histidini]